MSDATVVLVHGTCAPITDAVVHGDCRPEAACHEDPTVTVELPEAGA
jgi:hypothetical protein